MTFVKRFEFDSITQIPTGLPPIGLAGGDLSGTYPNPTVSKLLGNSIPVNSSGYLNNDGTGVLTWIPISAGGVTSFNTRTGAITLTSGDVTTALGYTPYNATNPSGYITSATVSSTYLPIANPAFTGSLTTGTLGYSDTGILAAFQSTTAGYNQIILQNSSTGTTSSSDFVVNNSASTATTNYGDFGMNSTGFTGSGAFNQPSYVYLSSTSVDLAIGTTTSNAIHFVINGGTTDAMTISSAGVVTIASDIVATLTATQTFTNKRITSRPGTVASSATPTVNTDNVDYFSITALAVAITSMTTNLSGTPTIGQQIWFAITDNGTARAITWGASFEASGTFALPTTTVISTRLDVGFIWNETTSKWRCIGAS